MEEYDRDRIFGLKTIRFQKGDWGVKEACDFLREHFPCSRVVVNIRSDVEGQFRSMNTTFTEEHKGAMDADHIQKMNDFMIDVAEELGEEMARLIDMNEWTQDVEVLNDLIGWLGFRDCRYQAVVHENANGYGRDNETEPDIGDDCHYLN